MTGKATEQSTADKKKVLSVSVNPELADFIHNLRFELRMERAEILREAVTEFAVKHGYKA